MCVSMPFARAKIPDIPVKEADSVDPAIMVEARNAVADARCKVSEQTLRQAYVAWMG